MSATKKMKKTSNLIMTHVAVWQFMAFILLLCLVWISEVMDLPALFFRAKPSGVAIERACTLTAAVFFCAIIAVGNTYVQQRHILKGLFIICSSCGKVRIKRDAWEDLDDYLERHTLATFERDLCPDCFKTMEKKITEVNEEQWRAGAHSPQGGSDVAPNQAG